MLSSLCRLIASTTSILVKHIIRMVLANVAEAESPRFEARDCAAYCGLSNEYCCTSGSTCYTSNGIAGCSATSNDGAIWYTTTWTACQTFTSAYTSSSTAQTTPIGEHCIPSENSGQIACGNICCASWQYCAFLGQCVASLTTPSIGTHATVSSNSLLSTGGITTNGTVSITTTTTTSQTSSNYKLQTRYVWPYHLY
jgi:hypothetical protein